jgi:hypothetical protein
MEVNRMGRTYANAARLALTWLIICAVAPGAVAQMTVEQARQLLLPHVQAPDTNLDTNQVNLNPVIEISLEGHPEYLFYGDAWGTYRINAVTGEKSIFHVPRSLLPAGDQPATTLPATQLRQIAIDYVAAHFPGYTPNLFTVYSGDIEPDYDTNEYYVHFICTAPSGAELPLWCLVVVEEDVGFVKRYDEGCIPVTISTVPAVSQAQAIEIGRAWIAQNFDPDPSWGALNEPREYYPVEFKVEVDPFLNQALVYRIPYEAMVLYVEAQTGAVIATDGWAGGGDGPRKKDGKRAKPVESIWQVTLPHGNMMHHGAIAIPGRVYLWHKQAQALGITVRQEAGRVVLTCKGKVTRLPLARTRPDGRRIVAWLRKRSLYLPVAALRRLTDRVRVDLSSHVVTLVPAFARFASAPRK